MTDDGRYFTLGPVKTRIQFFLVIVALVSIAGCRQADGPMPQQQSDTGNRIGDMSRDLLAIVNGDPAGEQDFADDLSAFAQGVERASVTQRFARQVATAVRGTRLSEQAAQQLAYNCWVAVAATQFSERQVDDLQGEFRNQLVSLGVNEQTIAATLSEVEAVQAAIGSRPRRWYEVF